MLLVFDRFNWNNLTVNKQYINIWNHLTISPVGLGCRIYQLHLCTEVGPTPMSALDMILSDREVP